MNAFLSTLEKYDIKCNALRRGELTTLQVNMGDLCNQSCRHCHIEASPQGKNIMSREVVDDILKFVSGYKIKTLDITGGAPELNPNFKYLTSSARPLVNELIVRSNLTVFFEKGKECLPGFFKEHRVHLICSLPCYTKENVDRQRGEGVFEKSICALRLLNEAGFARRSDLELDLVHNSLGAHIPGAQGVLEKDYKKALKDNYEIEFNRLLTITNVAIKRFKKYLESSNEYEKYTSLLEGNFNPTTLQTLMCRTFLSVGYDGRLYDCDFNLALGFALKDRNSRFLNIGALEPAYLEGREIIIGEHCLACTAGGGSSCQGALANFDASKSPTGKQDRKKMIQEYYGTILQSKNDLKTSACCTIDSIQGQLKAVMKNIEPEILDRFYGCGSPIPPLLKGCRVLDLGCGTGRDVYLASYLAGEEGFSTGIDMTDEQLEVAVKYKEIQMKRFGFKYPNVDFKKGYIEDLKESGIEDNSQDVVISNCVINLSPDKRSVFREIFRVLKSGGELYFSDVYSDRRVPEEVKNDPVIYGECMGGAMYIEDFRRMLKELGCPDYRVISKRKIDIRDPQILEKIGSINFYSVTIRAFKLDDLEETCEDYGQAAIYLGSIPDNPHQFQLDNHHVFISHKPMLVCGNTASMLTNTRFAGHFKVMGNRNRHFGPFPCGPAPKGSDSAGTDSAGSCC